MGDRAERVYDADGDGKPAYLDSDGDGTTDDLDKTPVQGAGCGAAAKVQMQRGAIIILEQVQFATGKAVIKEESFALLDAVAAVLSEHGEVKKVLVEGHTDDVGADDKNLALSDKRAKAVMAYLVKKGVAAERLDAKGFGKTKPLVPNDSDANRAKNRRVAFTIVEPAR